MVLAGVLTLQFRVLPMQLPCALSCCRTADAATAAHVQAHRGFTPHTLQLHTARPRPRTTAIAATTIVVQLSLPCAVRALRLYSTVLSSYDREHRAVAWLHTTAYAAELVLGCYLSQMRWVSGWRS